MTLRARTAAAVWTVTLALLAGACSDGGGDRASAPAPPTEPTSSSTTTAPSSDFDALLAEHRRVDFDPGDEPTDEEAYALLLADHQADLSSCSRRAETETGSCPMPASMSAELEEQVNVQILLDSSGSMADRARGGTKMEVARRVLGSFLDDLPASAHVSLRVFGHQGTGSGEDKPRSCRSTAATGFGPPDSPGVRERLRHARPAGWTPLGRALAASRRDFAQMDGEASNFVYVVSDGVETCGGDPVAEARRLSGAGVGVDVNVVGFDVDQEAARQLRRVAEASDGSYTDAGDADQLDRAFRDYDWQTWTDWYNCVYNEAAGNYNAHVNAALDNRNCVVNAVLDERNAIVNAALDQRNTVVNAALDERNAIVNASVGLGDDEAASSVRDQAEDRKDALLERAEEIKDHILTTAEQRKDELVTAAESRKERRLESAFRKREQLIEMAQTLRGRAGG